MYKYIKLIFIKIKIKINLYISKLLTSLIKIIKYIRRQAKLVTRLHYYINNVSSNKQVFIKSYYIPLIRFNKNLNLLKNIYGVIILYYKTDKTILKYKLLITIIKKQNIKINNNQIETIFNILEIILNKNKNFIITKLICIISIFIILNIIIIIYLYYN